MRAGVVASVRRRLRVAARGLAITLAGFALAACSLGRGGSSLDAADAGATHEPRALAAAVAQAEADVLGDEGPHSSEPAEQRIERHSGMLVIAGVPVRPQTSAAEQLSADAAPADASGLVAMAAVVRDPAELQSAAAQALSRGAYDAALHLCRRLMNTLDSSAAAAGPEAQAPGQGLPKAEPPKLDDASRARMRAWAEATAGRAARLQGNPQTAVKYLRGAFEHTHGKGEGLAHEVVGMELSLAQVEGALKARTEEGAEGTEGDAELREAARRLEKLIAARPNRVVAPMRFHRAMALAAVDGGPTARGRKAAAKQAVAALELVLRRYPNHPRIGDVELALAGAEARQGRTQAAADALRGILLHRAGTPAAVKAEEQLEALRSNHPGVRVAEFSFAEQLDQAAAARRHRRLPESRKILEAMRGELTSPTGAARWAVEYSLAWTAYRERNYSECADIMVEVLKGSGSDTHRRLLSRCLDRAGRAQEAVDLWLSQAAKYKTKSRRSRGLAANALWQALVLAERGGLYAQARTLLTRYEASSRRYASERAWLRTWLDYRLGKLDKAEAGFKQIARSRNPRKLAARYFLGKIMLRSDVPADSEFGAQQLEALATDGDAFGYYALQARARLAEAGRPLPSLPALEAMPDVDLDFDHGRTQESFEEALAVSDASQALRRAAELHAIGYIEEARREFRYAADEYLTLGSGGKLRGPHNEDLVAGLGWKSKWERPRLRTDRGLKSLLRQPDRRAAYRASLRRLAIALEENNRLASLSSSDDYPYYSRWLLRAHRDQIEGESERRKVDPFRVWALMFTESRFRRHVVSPVGARGALQIMPWTGRQLVERLGEDGNQFNPDSLFEIDTNVELAVYYVSELMAKFQGQAPLAYASYNGGPSNVARWLQSKSAATQRGARPLELDEFVEEIPFHETYKYTRRVMQIQAAYSHMYLGQLPNWNNQLDDEVEDNIWF